MEQEIKNFIYLDEYKMYSISSQIFEGITDYLVSYKEGTIEKSDEQKGPISSGRVVADILKSESGTQEKKYLHDYTYTIFEKELDKLGKVFNISKENIDEEIEQIDNADFVRIKAKAIFNDVNILKTTIENINELGKALAYITNYPEMEEIREQFEKASKNTKDRNQKAKLKQQFRSLTNIEKLAKDSGLNINDEFLKNLTFVLDYGFQDQFIVQMSIGKYIFSADCKRDDFREDEHLLIRKYSRVAEKDFVLLGTVAQNSGKPTDYQSDDNENYEFQNLKEAIMFFVEKLTIMESSFVGRVANEIIIDSIAIYREI